MENASGEEYVGLEGLEEDKSPKSGSKFERFLDSRYFVAVCLVLVGILAFTLGRVSAVKENREPVRVTTSPLEPNPPNPIYSKGGAGQTASVQNAVPLPTSNNSEQVVASKNGTKYHFPWCAGAKQISDKNKITFNSFAEARASGYSPASNCKGLK